MTFTSNFGYHGCIEAMLGGQPDKKSPNLSKLTETGQGSEEKDPQRESLHDEGLLRRRLSRGSPPVEGRRAWFSRRAHTEQQQQGICGSSPSSSHARRLSAACW